MIQDKSAVETIRLERFVGDCGIENLFTKLYDNGLIGITEGGIPLCKDVELYLTLEKQMERDGCRLCPFYEDRFIALFKIQLSRSSHMPYSCKGCNNIYKE